MGVLVEERMEGDQIEKASKNFFAKFCCIGEQKWGGI